MVSKEEVLEILNCDAHSRDIVSAFISILVTVESLKHTNAFLETLAEKLDGALTELHIPELRQEGKIDF